jgi:RNA polymerase sigma-70 factor (ECF subfamily)
MTAISDDDQDRINMVRLAEGHDAGLNELMDRHGGRLFHYLVRSLQSEEEAADLAQETFVRVYQNRARFDARQRFSTWLYAIASNLVRSRYRWRSRHPQVSLDVQNEETGASIVDRLEDDDGTPSDSLQSTERAEAVRRAVAALPEELRQPLILAEWEDKPQAEIAVILNCTVKAVETRIYRARKQLRATLQPLLQPV